MNTASLELCKELADLSGWANDVDAGFIDKWDGDVPLYPLGYLLRKLPEGARLTRNKSNPRKRSNYHGEWSAGLYSNVKLADGQQADTPEDAAAKLCIELFKQGILPIKEQK